MGGRLNLHITSKEKGGLAFPVCGDERRGRIMTDSEALAQATG